MIQRVDWNDFVRLEDVAKTLQAGDVIAGSSDTVLGLLSAVTSEGKRKLDQIKKRNDMPYLVLVANVDEAKKLSPFFQTQKGAQLADAFWPGPLTLIAPAHKNLPDYMKSKTGGIAIRVPDHQGLQQLLSKVGTLFSTSANLSGQPVPQRLSDLDPSIEAQMSYLIGDDTGAIIASTIVDCTQEPPHIIREGIVSKNVLSPYL